MLKKNLIRMIALIMIIVIIFPAGIVQGNPLKDCLRDAVIAGALATLGGGPVKGAAAYLAYASWCYAGAAFMEKYA